MDWQRAQISVRGFQTTNQRALICRVRRTAVDGQDNEPKLDVSVLYVAEKKKETHSQTDGHSNCRRDFFGLEKN